MRRFPLWILLFLFARPVSAAEDTSAQLIAIGQGVSSPTSTSTVNFTSGYTSENPLGTIYQPGGRLTGEYDKDGSQGYGAELGYGQGQWGIAAGYYQRDCSGCKGRGAGDLGVSVADIGLGIRFAENLYGVGVILNTHGKHRFGFMGELNDSGGTNNKVTAFGAGYSFVASQVTFTVDASKLTYENTAITDQTVLVTPGLMLRVDMVQLSVNDRVTLNRNAGTTTGSGSSSSTNNNDPVHDFWFGIGIGGKSWHIAGYGDYVNELALAASLFF